MKPATVRPEPQQAFLPLATHLRASWGPESGTTDAALGFRLQFDCDCTSKYLR